MWGKQYYMYILASKPNGILYTGMTNDLIRRVGEHKSGAIKGFTQRYHVKSLVYFEMHETPENAIMREKRVKRWKRAMKNDLIGRHNPEWMDLYPALLAHEGMAVEDPGLRRDDKHVLLSSFTTSPLHHFDSLKNAQTH